MPRSGMIRTYIKELSESPRAEKLSFIPPFLVLIVEIILLRHAITINVTYVIELTIILLILSVIEILLVTREIHRHYQRTNFDRILTIRLDDFVMERTEKKNVKKLVEEFTEKYPKYSNYRSEVYHIVCQIMETHKEEALEDALENKLTKFIKRRKKMNVDNIIKTFIKKYPKYKKYRTEIYQATCRIMVDYKEK